MAQVDYSSPQAQFAFDINQSLFFKLDDRNYINLLGIHQLNTLENTSLLDIHLSTGHIIEPHYHQNAAELVYCISGAATVSILNPYTRQLRSYPIRPGQVANIPKGWWHYIVAEADNTHLLAIFDAPNPDVILGSDLLSYTPPDIMSLAYGIDPSSWKKAIEPVQPATFIGPRTSVPQQAHWPKPHQPQWMQHQHPQWPIGSPPAPGYGQWFGAGGMY